MNKLLFDLPVVDDWPPVSVEGIPCSEEGEGFRIDVAPLFVKDLSVGDVIKATYDSEGRVIKWQHYLKSKRSTIWLLRLARTDVIEEVLRELRALDCNTAQLPEFGCYSIDVPEECNISLVDRCLDKFDESCVAIAYPSFRHPD